MMPSIVAMNFGSLGGVQPEGRDMSLTPVGVADDASRSLGHIDKVALTYTLG